MSIPVVYEDKWLLVVDKPSGLLTVPTPKKEKSTLTGILNLLPCHRLDRDTSGLIIYAKSQAVRQKMEDAFRRKGVKKTYTAFIKGVPEFNRGEISFPIEKRLAVTQYKVVAKKKDFAIVDVYPLTGRTNQIRIHFSKIRHPVLGEERFAFRRDFSVRAKRLMLHAKVLEFNHPVTNKRLHLRCGLPQDMQEFLDNYS